MRTFFDSAIIVFWQSIDLLSVSFFGGAFYWLFAKVVAPADFWFLPELSLDSAVMVVFWVYYVLFWILPQAAKDLWKRGKMGLTAR